MASSPPEAPVGSDSPFVLDTSVLRQIGIILSENDFIILLTAMSHGRKLLTRDSQMVNALSTAGRMYSDALELLEPGPASAAPP